LSIQWSPIISPWSDMNTTTVLSRRHAERIGDIGPVENHSLGREAVYVRGLDHRVARAAPLMGALLIGYEA